MADDWFLVCGLGGVLPPTAPSGQIRGQVGRHNSTYSSEVQLNFQLHSENQQCVNVSGSQSGTWSVHVARNVDRLLWGTVSSSRLQDLFPSVQNAS